MLLYTMLYIVLAYLMLFAALTNSVCLNNASFFFLFKYFLCQGYELSGEIALKNNHYYYYYYTCYQLCHRPPDGRLERRRYLIGRLRPNIQQYLADEPLSNTSYKSAISSIHQDVVRTVIESSSSKLLNGRPPHIVTAEQTLPRKLRTILAQLRTGHSRILGQYMNRIDPTMRNHCHNCGHPPHDTHHLFDCPSKPTTLTVES